MTANDSHISTTHIGSLPRPPELPDRLTRRQDGEAVDPDGWTLIPAVVDVKTNTVDHPEAIADRLERVADAVDDGTPLVAVLDCGFGTQAGLGTVDPEVAWAKLEAFVEGAEVASERLDRADRPSGRLGQATKDACAVN